jgi:adenosylcobinamide-GDP ribazoletransferase
MIRATWRRFRMALALLTRIPVAYPDDAREADIGPSAAMYPVVGLVVGVVVAATHHVAAVVWGGAAMPVVAALAVWIAITGALHLDGVMDAADGLFSHRPRLDKLRIMKDPQVGAFGAVALAVLLMSKAAALSALPPHRVWGALLLAPVLGRLAMVYAGAAYPYARPEGGMGGAFATQTRWSHVGLAALAPLLVVALLRDVRMLAVLPIVGLCVWWLARRMARSLGGLTGDTYGALCEATEVVTLMALGVAIR